MSFTNLRRVAVGAGAFALTASFIGFGTANAEPASADHVDGASNYTRTVSDTTPKAGDTITVKTEFKRSSTVDEYVYNIKDFQNACLTYVDGSAKWNDAAIDGDEVTTGIDEETTEGTVLVKAPNVTSWRVTKKTSRVFSVDYKVGADCLTEVPLTSTFHYGGSLGKGIYDEADFEGGPSITVQKPAEDTGGGDTDTPDAGSLGNFFGSLSTGSASS